MEDLVVLGIEAALVGLQRDVDPGVARRRCGPVAVRPHVAAALATRPARSPGSPARRSRRAVPRCTAPGAIGKWAPPPAARSSRMHLRQFRARSPHRAASPAPGAHRSRARGARHPSRAFRCGRLGAGTRSRRQPLALARRADVRIPQPLRALQQGRAALGPRDLEQPFVGGGAARAPFECSAPSKFAMVPGFASVAMTARLRIAAGSSSVSGARSTGLGRRSQRGTPGSNNASTGTAGSKSTTRWTRGARQNSRRCAGARRRETKSRRRACGTRRRPRSQRAVVGCSGP